MSDIVEKVKKVSGTLEVEEAKLKPKFPANQDYFESLMKQKGTAGNTNAIAGDAKIAEEVQKPSLMEQVKNSSTQVDPTSKVTPTQLIQQTQETIQRIDQVKQVLSTPNLQIGTPYQNLLKNKLNHIDENLKIALSKAGAEFSSSEVTPTTGLLNPVERYLGYLTSSQDQLSNLGSQLQTMNANRQELTPANMLAIQIKVGVIQQELEFFTGLLNKALDSTKTLMNVQV